MKTLEAMKIEIVAARYRRLRRNARATAQSLGISWVTVYKYLRRRANRRIP